MSDAGSPAPSSESATPARADRVGEVLLGKYRVERELGRGGMGFVVAARHLELGELVAIKMILGEYAANDDMVRRFMREARAAAQIASDHVVRVNDVGRLPSGEPYMVMELLKGEDLEEVLARAPLPVPEAIDLLLQVLEAVAEAHAVGIVHRDLKPANLFLTRRRSGAPCIKVLDFGISKLVGDETSRTLALTQGVLGSPLYMSPEQLRTPSEVDGRGDVWSLGVILFQMLTQEYPFVAASLPELVAKVLDAEPVRLRALLPDAPEELERILLRALAKDRDHRYPSVTELAGDLAPYGTERARTSLVAIETALPSRANVSSPTLPAPPIVATEASAQPPPSKPKTLAMWPNRASTLEPVDTSVATAEPEPVSPIGRRLFGISVVVGIASLAVIAFEALPRSAPSTPSASTQALDPPPSTHSIPDSGSAPTLGTAETTASVATATATTAASPSPPRAGKPKLVAPTTGTERPKPTASATTIVAPAPPPPAANCSTPYKLDGNGKHVPKPECL